MRLPTDAHAERAARMFATGQAELHVLVSEAVARGANGTARYYRNQLGAVNEVLRHLEGTALPAVAESVSQGYVSGALVAERTLGINGNFSGVHTEAVQVLVDNAVNPLGEALRTVGRQTEDVFRRAALNDVALGIIEGRTRKDVSRAFRNNLVREGLTCFVDKSGAKWSLAGYSKMVARTTTREAVSHGTANRLLENGHDLVTISEHAHEIDECTDYEGRTFSLTGETDGYDMLDQYPPFHPNCVHVLTPAAETFDKFEQSVLEDTATAKPPIVTSPLDTAAANVLEVANDWKPPQSLQYSLDRLAPNGMEDPALDLPWAPNETKRQRIDSLLAEHKAKDVAYLTRVGDAIERELPKLTEARVNALNDQAVDAAIESNNLDEAIDKLTRKALALNKRVVLDDAAALAERDAVIAERTALEEQYSAARERRHRAMSALTSVEADTRLELLARVRPGYGTGEIRVARKSKVSGLIQEQARFLPREWIETVESAKGKLSTKTITGRAHYQPWDHTIHLRRNDASTALHEFGHAVESGHKNVLAALKAFYRHRTDGEELVRLADVHKGHGYSASETTRLDRFTHAYMGKDYGGSAYELLTMGLEGVFYGRHGLHADAEYTSWILGMLAVL